MRYFLTALLIVLAGCVPYSDHPLTEPDKANLDTSIFGTWYWHEESDSGYIHFGTDYSSGLLRVVMLEYGRDGRMDATMYSGHTSFLGGNNYLNLKQTHPQQDDRGYMIIRYRLKNGMFGISLMDNTAAENAIKEGSLKGKIKGYTHITEGQPKLQTFILENDEKLYKDTAFLKRLHLPATDRLAGQPMD